MALLSGSGATVFGVFPDKTSAARACELFSGEPQNRVFLVETCVEPLGFQ
jgi:4-diphosphocytidyl-2C-methyl-D-erythritol kinase